MRKISVESIADAVEKICGTAACDLPADVRSALEKCGEKEQSELGKSFFRQYLTNADIAANERIPLCQDTGFAVYPFLFCYAHNTRQEFWIFQNA